MAAQAKREKEEAELRKYTPFSFSCCFSTGCLRHNQPSQRISSPWTWGPSLEWPHTFPSLALVRSRFRFQPLSLHLDTPARLISCWSTMMHPAGRVPHPTFGKARKPPWPSFGALALTVDVDSGYTQACSYVFQSLRLASLAMFSMC